MKVGDEFFEAYVDTDEGSVTIFLWVITALRSGRAHACMKTDYTWIKRSSKTGDYGWAPNLSDFNRKSFKESAVPQNWARTKAAAYSKALPEVEAAIKRLTKIRSKITGQRTKARRKSQASYKRIAPTTPHVEGPTDG